MSQRQSRDHSPTIVGSPGSEDLAVVEVAPNLKTRSMQEILHSSSMDTIAHHDGSDNTYMANKVLKLQTMHDPAQTSGLQVDSDIFKGCCVFVNGDTTPTRYEIQRLVVLHGGHFDAYKTSRTTHFLCDHFPNTKLAELSKNHPRIKIKYVTVAWLVDSISNGRRLNEAHFIPPGLQQGQRMLAFGPSSGRAGDSGVCASSGVEPYGAGAKTSLTVSSPSSSSVALRSPPWRDADDSSPGRLVDVSSSPTFSSRQPSTPGSGSTTLDQDSSSNPTKRRSASDTNYMKQYYGASRLHFIGTWRSRLPALIKELSQEKATPGGEEQEESYTLHRFAMDTDDRACSIIHIDMDCFFVSVLIRTRPQLWTKPVAVAHSSSAGSSEVSSCNYPARALGVKAGMFMKRARALCPNLTVLRYDFTQYEEVSKQLYKICLAFSPVVQPVSVDELYVECAAGHDVPAATKFLREEIFRQTGCSASAGVGRNMLLARLGTAKAKPNGLFIVPADATSPASAKKPADLSPVMRFMATVPLRSLPGVGRKLMKKLLARAAEKPKALPRLLEASADDRDDREEEEEEDVDEEDEDEGGGVHAPPRSVSARGHEASATPDARALTTLTSAAFETCADLWDIPLSTLTTWVGGPTLAKTLYEACRGRDEKKLQSMQDIGTNRKSVGAEVNYGHRYESDDRGTAMQKAERFLLNLCEEVVCRLAQAQMYGYCVTVKLMKRRATAPVMSAKFMGHGACDNLSKSETLTTAIGKSDLSGSYDAATSSLSRTAMSLFHSMVGTASPSKFPPEDIRGMGVQVTRLEMLGGVLKTGSSSGAARSSSASMGQGRNEGGFQKLFATADTAPVAKKVKQPGYEAVTRAHDFELPPASQLDYSVLAELEDSLAKHCDNMERAPQRLSAGSSKKRRMQVFDSEESVRCSSAEGGGYSHLALSYSQVSRLIAATSCS